jgi:L-ascorbate metabolism protein UlaG (beta-lactamase superfamily)
MNMKKLSRRLFLQQAGLVSGTVLAPSLVALGAESKSAASVQFRLLRHATLLLEINNRKILVDPMLAKKETMDPVGNAGNTFRIPMVDLPVNDDELKDLLKTIDAVFITHTHRDHWDAAAQQLINKQTPVFCQPADEEKILKQGFTHVTAIQDDLLWNSISIHRTKGQHGTGETGKLMGTVSGFVFSYSDQTVYIAGDTIWCNDVKEAIEKYSPTHIIVNGGGAKFLTSDPITMTTEDVLTVSKNTKATISVVHLETINHCLQKRSAFTEMVAANQLMGRIHIPLDGEWIKC